MVVVRSTVSLFSRMTIFGRDWNTTTDYTYLPNLGRYGVLITGTCRWDMHAIYDGVCTKHNREQRHDAQNGGEGPAARDRPNLAKYPQDPCSSKIALLQPNDNPMGKTGTWRSVRWWPRYLAHGSTDLQRSTTDLPKQGKATPS